MTHWIKRHFLIVIGMMLVVVFVLGGLATNESGTGGYRDMPAGENTGHYTDNDKKIERR